MDGSEGKLRSEQSVCWFRAVKGTLRNFIIPAEGPFKDVQVYLPQTYRLAYCLHRFLHVKALLGTFNKVLKALGNFAKYR